MTIGQCWKQVGEDLGLKVEAPFKLALENGITLELDALVRNFGAPSGMLITADFKKVEKIDELLTKMGYGFSTMPHPSEYYDHDSEGFKHILKDWGWSGDPDLIPTWFNESPGPFAGYAYSDEY